MAEKARFADGIYDHIGRSVRAHRLAASLTLEQLAEASGLSAAYIGQIERSAKKVSLQTLSRLADGLGTPLDQLVNHTFHPPRPSAAKRIEQMLRALTPREQEVMVSIVRNLIKGLRATR